MTSSPAAYDTLSAFFRDTGTKPRDYDLVVTGDLGELGHAIVRDFFSRDGVDLGAQTMLGMWYGFTCDAMDRCTNAQIAEYIDMPRWLVAPMKGLHNLIQFIRKKR